MKIHTYWILREGEDIPELMAAVDEETFIDNHELYEIAKARAESSLRATIYEGREIVLKVDAEEIENKFKAGEVSADVE